MKILSAEIFVDVLKNKYTSTFDVCILSKKKEQRCVNTYPEKTDQGNRSI